MNKNKTTLLHMPGIKYNIMYKCNFHVFWCFGFWHIGVQLEELDEEEHGKTVKVDITIITPVLQDYLDSIL